MCVGSLCGAKKQSGISKSDTVLANPEAFWEYPEKNDLNQSQDQNIDNCNTTREMASRKLERRPTLVENEAIDKLYHHFIRLDKDGNGYIDKNEFLSIPAVAENPLAVRFLHLLDVDKGGSIDFNEFVAGMSIFSKKTSKIKKLRFAFSVYDLDQDGFISNGELFTALKIMTGDHLTDVQLQQIVDRTIRDADTDGDGKISFEEFQTIVLAKNSGFLELWNFEGI